jgi:hypothetical protein
MGRLDRPRQAKKPYHAGQTWPSAYAASRYIQVGAGKPENPGACRFGSG